MFNICQQKNLRLANYNKIYALKYNSELKYNLTHVIIDQAIKLKIFFD